MLSFIVGIYSIPGDEPSTEEDTRVDWIGATLVTVGLVLIVFVLSEGEVAHRGWSSSCKPPVPHCFPILTWSILCRYHRVTRARCSPNSGICYLGRFPGKISSKEYKGTMVATSHYVAHPMDALQRTRGSYVLYCVPQLC